jgi:hypothetical protein
MRNRHTVSCVSCCGPRVHGVRAAVCLPRESRNVNPEWGYVAPAPGFMRTARLIVIAAIIGATAGAAIVFSLLDRPVAEESVAARTLVAPDPSRPVPASTSVAAQQPTEPQQAKSLAEAQNSAEQKVPPASAGEAATRRQPSELPTTSPSQRPTSAAALAEAPAVKDTPSAWALSNTLAVAPDPAPAPKPQSKRPRMTSRTAPRNGAPRYDSRRYYARSYDAPRYGYEPRYGFEQGSRGFAWAPYGPHDY